MYGVRLYTFPRNTVQASSGVACVATSAIDICLFRDAPRSPARSGSRFVRRIQSICEYPAPSCTFFGAPSPPDALCVPADAGALSLLSRCTPPGLSALLKVAFARRPPNDRPPPSPPIATERAQIWGGATLCRLDCRGRNAAPRGARADF
jgi:hypothetical protein